MDSTLFKYKRRKNFLSRRLYSVLQGNYSGQVFFILLLPDLPLQQLSLQLPRHRRDNNS